MSILTYRKRRRILKAVLEVVSKESSLLLLCFGVSLSAALIAESGYLGLISILFLIGAAVCSAIEKAFAYDESE